MAERTRYQEKIIRNYYDQRDALALQRLSEHVSNLYLSEGKKRAQTWKWIVTALEQLKVPKGRIEHLVQQDNPELVARLVQELMGK